MMLYLSGISEIILDTYLRSIYFVVLKVAIESLHSLLVVVTTTKPQFIHNARNNLLIV